MIMARDQDMSGKRIARSTGLPDRRQNMKRPRASVGDRLAKCKTAKRRDEILSRTVVVPADILDALEPAAEARGMHVNALVRALITTIVDEDMVSAVLDDGGDTDQSEPGQEEA